MTPWCNYIIIATFEPGRKKYSLLRDEYLISTDAVASNDKNHESLDTFRTLKLLFPMSKNEFVLVLFQFPKMIVLNLLLLSKIHHSCFLLISKMYRCFIPK